LVVMTLGLGYFCSSVWHILCWSRLVVSINKLIDIKFISIIYVIDNYFIMFYSYFLLN
jgi:hypothetical protein